jgi:CIC family chloride channel protein
MVRRIAPESSGSAIPYVKTALREGWAGNPLRIITVKFVGGIMAIGGGLALGREGPAIQIGAAIGHLLGKTFRQNDNDRRVLLAAAAGAGLATAFNAPIAGAVFVLEELVGQFDVTISIVTLGTSAGAIGIAQLLLGRDADLSFPCSHSWMWAISGRISFWASFLGVLGVAYSRAIPEMIALQTRLNRIAVEWRAAAVGAIIGLLGWFAPDLIGAAISSRSRSSAALPCLAPSLSSF